MKFDGCLYYKYITTLIEVAGVISRWNLKIVLTCGLFYKHIVIIIEIADVIRQ